MRKGRVNFSDHIQRRNIWWVKIFQNSLKDFVFLLFISLFVKLFGSTLVYNTSPYQNSSPKVRKWTVHNSSWKRQVRFSIGRLLRFTSIRRDGRSVKIFHTQSSLLHNSPSHNPLNPYLYPTDSSRTGRLPTRTPTHLFPPTHPLPRRLKSGSPFSCAHPPSSVDSTSTVKLHLSNLHSYLPPYPFHLPCGLQEQMELFLLSPK